MSRISKRTPEEIEAYKKQYGEVVSFRLKRDNPDHAEILKALEQVPKQDRVDLFARAMMDYWDKPIRDDNAATAVELREMVSELLQALGTAHDLIRKLSNGVTVTQEIQQAIDDNSRKLNPDFITQMNQQKRPPKVLRQPSSNDEE